MKIEILGTGCARCNDLFRRVKAVAGGDGKFIQIEKVEDPMKIMAYGVMNVPGLVVDGEVKVTGRVPEIDELEKLIHG